MCLTLCVVWTKCEKALWKKAFVFQTKSSQGFLSKVCRRRQLLVFPEDDLHLTLSLWTQQIFWVVHNGFPVPWSQPSMLFCEIKVKTYIWYMFVSNLIASRKVFRELITRQLNQYNLDNGSKERSQRWGPIFGDEPLSETEEPGSKQDNIFMETSVKREF